MDQTVPTTEKTRDRLAEITLDTKSLGRSSANVEHEREVAIFDILDGNAFCVDGMDAGPYKLHLAMVEDRLLLAITAAANDETVEHSVSLTPLKRIVKDYFMICEFLLRSGPDRASGTHSADRCQPPCAPRRRKRRFARKAVAENCRR